ncbi:hypothetical protein ACFQ0G_34015 [Streptomyces chiangmaiensis]
MAGPHPARVAYASYLTFSAPDGNGWVVQEVKEPFPRTLTPRQPPKGLRRAMTSVDGIGQHGTARCAEAIVGLMAVTPLLLPPGPDPLPSWPWPPQQQQPPEDRLLLAPTHLRT